MRSYILLEDSTTLDLLRKYPQISSDDKIELMYTLHNTFHVPHDMKYEKIASELRGRYYSFISQSNEGSVILFIGATGIAAIITNDKRKKILTVVVDGSAQMKSLGLTTLIQSVIQTVSEHIGNIIDVYIGNEENIKYVQRKENIQKKDIHYWTYELVKKFKPILGKMVDLAIADIKGHMSNQIKNMAYIKATKKVNKLQKLLTIKNNLENDFDYNEEAVFNMAVHNAIIMTAGYLYPEQTGDIQQTSEYNTWYVNTYYGLASSGHEMMMLVAQNAGVDKVLNRLEKHDSSIMPIILKFTKQEILHI